MTSEGNEEMMVVLAIRGRSTGWGAREEIKIKEIIAGKAEVKRWGFSRTGNHWHEALLISRDFSGTVYHINISNSGRHWCSILKFKDGRLEEELESIDGLCPIHHRRTYKTYVRAKMELNENAE